jgi:succinoglycan biosynthesis transport protein ExoP
MLNLTQLLLIFKARFLAFFITFLVVIVLVAGVTFSLSKSYTASTSIVINYKGVDPVTGFAVPAQLMASYLTTQIGVITSHKVALKAVDKLGITNAEVIKESFQAQTGGVGDIRDWAANFLVQNLSVVPDPRSNIIDITYKSRDPMFSKQVADTFAAVYMDVNIELSNQPSKNATAFLYKQRDQLREELMLAEQHLVKYQQDNGITSSVENADIANAKLNNLSTYLAGAEADSIEALKRTKMASKGDMSPDILASPLVQSLKMQLNQAESKRAQLSRNYADNHPNMQAVENEISKLRTQLNNEISRAQSSVENTSNIYKQREAELKKAVADQKEKLLNLNSNRGQLDVLKREVQNAQMAYDDIYKRISQTDLEASKNQSDVMILNPAVLPTSPSSPKVAMNLFFGTFAAIFLGLLVAFIKEALDRKVRCIKDIEDAVDFPVIIMIGNKSAKKPEVKFLDRFKPLLLTKTSS